MPLLLTIPVALVDGWRRYGAVALLVFVAGALVVSNGFEDLSIATGFPFGHYPYEVGPQILFVPVYIGPVYAGLGYVCWRVAGALLNDADAGLGAPGSPSRRIDVVGTTAVGCSAFPSATTWAGGSSPTSSSSCSRPTCTGPRADPRGGDAGPPDPSILIYAALGLAAVSRFTVSPDAVVVDPAGRAWRRHALDETMLTINVFGPVVLALLAAVVAARTRAAPVDRESALDTSGAAS